jgi:hypothetical protein
MTKLAYLIGKEEGDFKPGTIPSRRNNPGDLRHSPHSSHVGIGPDDVGIIGTPEDGWADLERQLQIDAERGMTLQTCLESWAPPSENNTAKYVADVLAGFGGAVTADTPLTEVLKIQA